MKKIIDAREIGSVTAALMMGDCRSAVKYIDEKTIVRATWRNKPNGENTREEIVVTIGCPNYLERAFVNKCKQAGEKFPIRTIQLKYYPIKKK